MAFLDFKNVRIAGFSASVPKFVAGSLHPILDVMLSHDNLGALVVTIGVWKRGIS